MKKILIVDDKPAILEIFKEMFLDTECFQVEAAETSFEAEGKFKKLQPDLLILDVALPDLDGRSLLDKLNKDPRLAQCKVVMMSGVAEEDETVLITDKKVDLFFQKPFDLSEAKQKILSLLDVQQ